MRKLSDGSQLQHMWETDVSASMYVQPCSHLGLGAHVRIRGTAAIGDPAL